MQKPFVTFLAAGAYALLAVTFLLMIRSVDRLRFEFEKINIRLNAIEEKLQSPRQYAKLPQAGENSAHEKLANSEFYDKSAKSGGRFISAVSADSQNLNELLTNDAFVSQLHSYINDSLAERNYRNNGKFEPKLAEKWSISEDGKTFKIKIRKGVLWHDFTDPVTKKQWKNKELTADDFKFYIDTVKNKDVAAAALRSYFSNIDRVNVTGRYDFEVVWRKKYFKSLEMTLSLSPLPKHLYYDYEGPFNAEKFNTDHERNRIAIGVGPYRFSEWEKGRKITLERFEKYYGAAYGIMPPLNTVCFEIIQHPGTRLQAVVSGAINETSLTAEQWINNTDTPAFSGKNKTVRKVKYPAMAYNYLGMNLKNPVFSGKKTRRALAHLVDTQRIIREIYHGLASPATGPFFSGSDSCDKSVRQPEFSVAKAKALLAGDGWKTNPETGIMERNGLPLKFTVMYPNANPVYARMLPLIRQDMAKAGVKMELLGLEWSVCVQRLEKKNFEMCAMGWTCPLLSDPYQLWHSSQADIENSSNMISFRNKEADSLIESIRVELDDARRNELCHRFHRLIADESPYIFLVSPYSLSAVSAKFRNLRIFDTGYTSKILWLP